MNEQVDTKETDLNRKLAEWAGFYGKVGTRKSADFNAVYLDENGKFKKMLDTYEQTLWHDPEIAIDSGCRDYWYAENGLPNFTHSLDACFKWLVPQLLEKEYSVSVTVSVANSIGIVRDKFDRTPAYWTENHREKPALALCLAIEKLIKDPI